MGFFFSILDELFISITFCWHRGYHRYNLKTILRRRKLLSFVQCFVQASSLVEADVSNCSIYPTYPSHTFFPQRLFLPIFFDQHFFFLVKKFQISCLGVHIWLHTVYSNLLWTQAWEKKAKKYCEKVKIMLLCWSISLARTF